MKEREHNDLSPGDEELVERLVREGIDPADAEGDPRLRRILSLQRGLDAAATGDSATGVSGSGVSGSGPTGTPAAGKARGEGQEAERRVEELVRERLGPKEAAPAPGFRLLRGPLPILASLAALALLGLSLWLVYQAGVGGPETVGGNEEYGLGEGDRTDASIQIEEAEDGAAQIVWEVQPRLGTEYTVEVYAEDPNAGGALLASSEPLDEPRWRPAEDHTAGETPVSAWPETVWIVIKELRLTSSEEVKLVDQSVVR